MARGKALPTTRRRALIAIGAVAVLAIAGCGGSSSAKHEGARPTASFYTGWPLGGTPKRGGTAIVDQIEAANSLDPYAASTSATLPVDMALYDQLVELVPSSEESKPVLEPGLASSWGVSPDHLTYTFHIREGVRFSNGQPLTAEDVAFSLRTAAAPTAAGYPATTDWKQVSAAGPHIVQLRLKKPQATTLEVLDAPSFSIVPKNIFLREGPKRFGLHPVGTGAFMLKSAAPGFTTTNLVRNPYYWRAGKPYLDGLVFNQVESDNARVLAVRSGAATVAQQIPYAQVPSLKDVPGVKMLVGPEWGASFAVFNREKAPFTDVNVRRALLYATPREEIIRSVYKGLGTPANSLWGALKYWDPHVPFYPYDIAKAKELIKHSSVPNGFSMTIDVTGGESQGELLASILQSSYAQIGVHVTIQPLQSATLDSNFFTGKTQFVIFPPEGGWSDWYEPDADASFYLDNNEPAGFTPKASPEVLAEITKAITSASQSERQRLWSKIQYQTYWQEALFIPIVNLVSLNLVSDKLRGFEVMPSIYIRWENLWLEQ